MPPTIFSAVSNLPNSASMPPTLKKSKGLRGPVLTVDGRTIPKPKGEPGRSPTATVRPGYHLETEMRLNTEHGLKYVGKARVRLICPFFGRAAAQYHGQKQVHRSAQKHLVIGQSWRQQDLLSRARTILDVCLYSCFSCFFHNIVPFRSFKSCLG